MKITCNDSVLNSFITCNNYIHVISIKTLYMYVLVYNIDFKLQCIILQHNLILTPEWSNVGQFLT